MPAIRASVQPPPCGPARCRRPSMAQPLTARDREIAEAIGPVLAKRGLLLIGLDVIGDWLTEVNVTSPTCMRELDAQFGLNIAGDLFDRIEASIA